MVAARRGRVAPVVGGENEPISGRMRSRSPDHPIEALERVGIARMFRRWPYFESKSLRFTKTSPWSSRLRFAGLLDAFVLSATRIESTIP